MTSSILRIALSGLLVAGALASCKKDKSDPSPSPGPMTLEFENVVAGNALTTVTPYTNAAGETFVVSKLRYYISHFVLTDDAGGTYTMPAKDSYFLIDQADPESSECELENIPPGNYVKATFTVGVDSAKAYGPASEHTGIFDSAGDMALPGGGYYFYDMRGTLGTSDAMQQKTDGAPWHPSALLRTVTVSFPEAAIVNGAAKRHPEAHLYHDVVKDFTGPGGTIRIADDLNGATGERQKALADNIASSFVVAHVHND